MIIDSKNDLEHLIFEDYKPAGLEALQLTSGYDWTSGAFIEYRNQKIGIFLEQLPRGTRSIKYRMRAEVPGKFSALPVQAKAMYAPEIRSNSDEWKVSILDNNIFKDKVVH